MNSGYKAEDEVILAMVLVSFIAADLAPAPDNNDVGTGGAQSWYTEYLAKLEGERLANLKGKVS